VLKAQVPWAQVLLSTTCYEAQRAMEHKVILNIIEKVAFCYLK